MLPKNICVMAVNVLEVALNVKLLGSWESAISAKRDIQITIHSVAPFGKSYGAQGLFELNSPDSHQVLHGLVAHPDIIKLVTISEEDNRIIGSVVARPWMTCATIIRADCYLEEAVISPEGTEWTILTPNEKTLSDLIMNLEKIGCIVRLISKHETESASFLTRRQELVLKRALELGYYDYPSRINAKELSNVLKIAPSTLSEILRRSEHKLVNFYLKKMK
jgi:predicted DNA binding protein